MWYVSTELLTEWLFRKAVLSFFFYKSLKIISQNVFVKKIITRPCNPKSLGIGVVVITSVQLHSNKPALSLSAG